MPVAFKKDIQYYRFCLYGFLKNLRFFEVFLLLFFLENGLSYLAIGTLYAAREITVNLLEIPSGLIADAFGRRRTMVFAFAFYVLSFILFYFSKSYTAFLLAMILFSFGDASRSGNHKAMIYHYLSIRGWSDQKVHYYGYTRSWSQMGSALSALSGAAIVFYSGSYRYIFLFSIIPYLLDMINVASYPAVLEGEMRKMDWQKMKHQFRQVFREFIRTIRSGKVLRVIGSLSMYSGYYKAVKDYLQPFIATGALALPFLITYSENQRTSAGVGMIFFVIYILSSMASRYAGRFAELFTRLSTLLNLSLLFGVMAGLLSGLFHTIELWWAAVVLFVVIYLVENIRKPAGVAYLGEKVDKTILSSVLSADSQLKSLAAAILAPLIGIFADLYGPGWGISMVSMLLLLFFPLVLIRSKVKNDGPEQKR